MATYAFTQLVPIALAEDEQAAQSLARAMLSDVAPDKTLDWSTLRLTFEDATFVEDWTEEGGAVVGTNVARMVIPEAQATAKLLRAEVDGAESAIEVERKRVLAPFLALADMLDQWDDHRGLWSRQAISQKIREAAQKVDSA